MKALHLLLEIIFLLSPGFILFAFAMGIRELFQDWKASRDAEKEKSAAGLQTRDATGKRGNSNQ